MKVNFNDSKTIIYLKNREFSKFNIKDEAYIEEKLREIFLILKERYDLDLKGYFEIDIYQDINYGAVFEIEKEEDSYDYFNQIEMKINLYKEKFLYEINDIIDKKLSYYQNKSNLYIKLDSNIENKMYLVEHVRVIYGEEKEKIERDSKKVII